MTENRQRRRFTEFKTEAVELALRSNKPMADIWKNKGQCLNEGCSSTILESTNK